MRFAFMKISILTYQRAVNGVFSLSPLNWNSIDTLRKGEWVQPSIVNHLNSAENEPERWRNRKTLCETRGERESHWTERKKSKAPHRIACAALCRRLLLRESLANESVICACHQQCHQHLKCSKANLDVSNAKATLNASSIHAKSVYAAKRGGPLRVAMNAKAYTSQCIDKQ